MVILDLVIAAVIIFGGYWLLRQFAYASPTKAAGLIRKLGGLGLMVVAGVLALRGGVIVAVPLFVAGLGLMGQSNPFAGFSWTREKQPGQRSRVATSLLAMELDHDSSDMTGEILAGPLRGRQLSTLTDQELQTFYAQCVAAGDQSGALLESWLNRYRAGWSDRWETPRQRTKPQSSSAMSRDEALAVLGLPKGATSESIRTAHRRLMKELHPDRGGSDYLAAKVNQAKDVLLQD
jgi:hypothetical protein